MSEPILPTVSVVIPVYRSERFIMETLASAWAQTGCRLDLIVVDDGSPDRVHDLLQPLFEQGRLRYIRQPNQGMATARNTGLAHALGEFITFLDHDDRWPEGKLSWQAAYLMENPDFVLVGGRSEWIDEEGAVLGMYGAFVGELSREVLFHANHLAGPGGTLMRTAAVRAIGGFEGGLFGTDDWDLYLRLLDRGRIALVDRVALRSLQHAGQASRDLPRMAEAARYTLCKNLNRLDASEQRRLLSGVKRAYRRTYGWVYKARVGELAKSGRFFDAIRLYASMWDWRGLIPRGGELLRPGPR